MLMFLYDKDELNCPPELNCALTISHTSITQLLPQLVFDKGVFHLCAGCCVFAHESVIGF